MSVRSNGGFPDNVFGGIKKLIENLTETVETNTNNISTNTTNIESANTTAEKKTVYGDLVTTATKTYTINHGHGGTQNHSATITKAGYLPLGVVGHESNAVNEYNNTSMGPAIRDIYLSEIVNGSCKLNAKLHAANNQDWTYHSTYKAYILWVKVR